MFRSLLLAGALLGVGAWLPATALADAPHKNRNDYVYCELRGQPVYIEGQNDPSHPLSADDITYMKALCVREALYGGHGEDYWSLPVTEADMKAAHFVVFNERGR